MPIFESESSIRISPKEYFDACSPSEQTGMCSVIMDEFNLVWEDEVKDGKPRPPRSFGQQSFNDALADLLESWYSLSKVDEEAILAIAKKYETI
jgi:hypothetical protein